MVEPSILSSMVELDKKVEILSQHLATSIELLWLYGYITTATIYNTQYQLQ